LKKIVQVIPVSTGCICPCGVQARQNSPAFWLVDPAGREADSCCSSWGFGGGVFFGGWGSKSR